MTRFLETFNWTVTKIDLSRITGLPDDTLHVLAGMAVLLFIAMALTPFVNNATVAIVLSPIAIEFAEAAHHPPAAYLIVVAAGASLDFLTPFGHHNNTLAMSIGSYRVSDFLRAGGPLALLGYIMTVLIVAAVWL